MIFHHRLTTYVIFSFIVYQKFIVLVRTTDYDDLHSHPWHLQHSFDPSTFNQEEIHHESQTHSSYIPESHDDIHQHPVSHIHAHFQPESPNDLPQEISQSQTDPFETPEPIPIPSPDLTQGSQPQETRNFISIITKNLLSKFLTTRIPYSEHNHTNYWPWNVEFVRLPPGYQSPINIHTSRIEKIDMPLLDTSSYQEIDESGELDCFNTGQTVECKVRNSTTPPYIQGGPLPSKYIFDNIHWHWGRGEAGSEHLIDGIAYAAEVHVVHYKEKYGSFEVAKKKQDGLAIFALFAKISQDDNADLEVHFNEILQHMLVPSQIYPSKWHDVFKFVHNIVLNNQQWMTYPGSLTSAPYKESVTWLVYFQCFDLSLNQLETLRSTLTTDGSKHLQHRRPVHTLRADSRPLLVRKSEQSELEVARR